MKVRVVVRSGSDGKGVLAYCPDFPGCSGVGRTDQEALAAVRQTLKDYLREEREALEPGSRQMFIQLEECS